MKNAVKYNMNVDCEEVESIEMYKVAKKPPEETELVNSNPTLRQFVHWLNTSLNHVGCRVTDVHPDSRGGFAVEIDSDDADLTLVPVGLVMPLLPYGDTSGDHTYMVIGRSTKDSYKFPDQYTEFERLLLEDIKTRLEEQRARKTRADRTDEVQKRLSASARWSTEGDKPNRIGSGVLVHESGRFSVIVFDDGVVFSPNDDTVMEDILDLIESVNWTHIDDRVKDHRP